MNYDHCDLVDVDAGDDEEDARSSGSAGEKATQAEDDSTFIFLLGFEIKTSFKLEFDLDNFY